MSKKLSIDIFVFLVVGFAINFFTPKVLAESGFNAIRLTVLLGTIVVSVPYLFRVNNGLAVPLRWLFFAQLFSTVGAYFSWGQTFVQSVQPMIPFALWPFFFYLVHVKYPIYKIERIMMIYGVLYLLCYAYQYLHSGVVIFGNSDEFQEQRGVTRIVFPAGTVLFLAAFIALCKIPGKTPNKVFYIGFVLAALAATVLQVTRQSIVLMMGVYALHLLRHLPAVTRFVILGAMVVGLVVLLNSDNAIVRGLENEQAENAQEGDKYIRVLEANYYLRELAPDAFASVVGNGPGYKSATDSSPLGDKLAYMTDTYGYYLSDVGIIGFYAMFGVFAVIAYAIIFVKGLRIKVPEEYRYLKYYLWFTLLTCLTSDSVYSSSALICILFVLYGLQTFNRPVVAPVSETAKPFSTNYGTINYV